MASHYIFSAWLIGTTLLSVVIVKAMIKIKVLDHPVQRSSHTTPTPKGGGVGIISAFIIGLWTALQLFHLSPLTPFIVSLTCVVLLLAVLSWFDDLHQWPALIKLTGQFIAATCLILFFPLPTTLSVTELILFLCMIFWVVYITNVLNFMDGLNGLASGIAAICCLFIYYYTSIIEFKIISLSLFCGLLGFLPFNYPRAQIFMGDVGSQACGLLLASFSLINLFHLNSLSAYPISKEPLLIFFLLFGLIYDVTFTLVRRLISGDPLLQAHRSHLYQMAHRCEISAAIITLIEWGFCIWGGLLILFIIPSSLSRLLYATGLLCLPQLLWTIYIYHLTKAKKIKEW